MPVLAEPRGLLNALEDGAMNVMDCTLIAVMAAFCAGLIGWAWWLWCWKWDAMDST